eukprot:1157217-Pelagomonas_calceolata.AAC.3
MPLLPKKETLISVLNRAPLAKASKQAVQEHLEKPGLLKSSCGLNPLGNPWAITRDGWPTRLASPRPRKGEAKGGSLAEWAYPSWKRGTPSPWQFGGVGDQG